MSLLNDSTVFVAKQLYLFYKKCCVIEKNKEPFEAGSPDQQTYLKLVLLPSATSKFLSYASLIEAKIICGKSLLYSIALDAKSSL